MSGHERAASKHDMAVVCQSCPGPSLPTVGGTHNGHLMLVPAERMSLASAVFLLLQQLDVAGSQGASFVTVKQ